MRLKMLVLLVAVASQYGPGVMERTIETRQTGRVAVPLPEVLPQVDGYVAVEKCSDIGKVLWLRGPGQEWEKFLAVDCAVRDGSDGTLSWMAAKNVLVEVDYPTAVRWGVVGRLVPVELGLPMPGPWLER